MPASIYILNKSILPGRYGLDIFRMAALLRQLLHRIHIFELLRCHAEYFLVARLLLHGYILCCGFGVQILELW